MDCTLMHKNIPVVDTLPDTEKNAVVYEVDVSGEFFETLGVAPQRGSDFRHSKERRAVVVSNSFWRNELTGAEDAIGKPIRISGFQYFIIGIMPESFDFPAGADIWSYRGETDVSARRSRQYRRETDVYGDTMNIFPRNFKKI